LVALYGCSSKRGVDTLSKEHGGMLKVEYREMVCTSFVDY
jgi:hypothetical protein